MSELTAEDLEGPDSSRPAHRRRHRRRNATLAVIGLVLAVGVAVYMAFGSTSRRIESQSVGFTIHGSESVTLHFRVTRPVDLPIECTVEALAADFSQVGVRTVTIPPGDPVQQDITVTVPTTQEPVSATVERCLPPAENR